MASCFRDTPGLDEEVSARTPQAAAPMSMLAAATSLSAWTNCPPASTMAEDMNSGMSFCGVIG